LLPLRLFLGVTFLYAGIQKFIDPQFFQPSTTGYIGKQVAAFARTSPLHDFLLQVVVPHADFFGHLVAYGEIAIGLGVLVGLLFRPAAFFGLLLSLLFYLSVTWRVYPYFYGADIVFVFSWLTLLLNGPLNTGLPAPDELLALQLIQRASPRQQRRVARILHYMLGTTEPAASSPITSDDTQPMRALPASRQRYTARSQQAPTSRRSFLLGTLTGGASVVTLAIFAYALRLFGAGGQASNSTAPGYPIPTPDTTQATAGVGTPTNGAIAQVSKVPPNSSISFTIPSTNDPGILVHLNNGQFVAYDALCTHAGCAVDYDPDSHLLLCPCHGGAFDPAQGGAAVQSPASVSLASVAIRIDNATGAIVLR
jgi:thiosulfate dehydrogenase [quinone] large subunit